MAAARNDRSTASADLSRLQVGGAVAAGVVVLAVLVLAVAFLKPPSSQSAEGGGASGIEDATAQPTVTACRSLDIQLAAVDFTQTVVDLRRLASEADTYGRDGYSFAAQDYFTSALSFAPELERRLQASLEILTAVGSSAGLASEVFDAILAETQAVARVVREIEGFQGVPPVYGALQSVTTASAQTDAACEPFVEAA